MGMIYLDNQATTYCDPKVSEEMYLELTQFTGNSSSGHAAGELASGRIDLAVNQVAEFINAIPSEIVITSGATESNNLAILGIGHSRLGYFGKRKKMVATKMEHKSVISPLNHLKTLGWTIIEIPNSSDGTVDINVASQLIDEETALVSIQLANSEIGTIQPVSVISEIAKKAGALVHCDAAQAVGKIPVDVELLNVDLLSFCGHKIYGPQGIGALWIRDGVEKVLTPLMFGGGDAKVLRPGTKPTSLIVGFGRACDIAKKDYIKDYGYVLDLRSKFESQLKHFIPRISFNGGNNRLPNNSSITFPGVDAEALLLNTPDIVASTGSACESGSLYPSRILLAIGCSEDQAYSTIRFGFGRFNILEEIERAAVLLKDAYYNLLSLDQ